MKRRASIQIMNLAKEREKRIRAIMGQFEERNDLTRLWARVCAIMDYLDLKEGV